MAALLSRGRRSVEAVRRPDGRRPALVRGRRGRGGRHRRPERRRQDDAAQRPRRCYPADAGAVTLGGADVSARRAHVRCRLGIGRTYQMPRPFDGMTVFENVIVGATSGGGARRRTGPRGLDVARAGGLLDVANRRAESLGLLDRKRLELAAGAGDRARRPAARRDRRRADRRRGGRAGRHDPRAARAGGRRRLDRAHRARARAGGRPAGLHGRRPRHRRRPAAR